MHQKKFVVIPGWVVSTEDFDTHYVSAHALMHLYQVKPHECIIVTDDMLHYYDSYLDTLLWLEPRVTGYRPVSDREREIYPLR